LLRWCVVWRPGGKSAWLACGSRWGRVLVSGKCR